MSSWVRRLGSVAILAALVLAVSGSSEQPTFSRSRWIAERSRTALFSGGVMPALGRVPASALTEAPVTAESNRAGKVISVRVSRDILSPDGGPGQPETQAEPYLAIDPEQELRLLAGYQEGRFVDGGARALTWAFSKNAGRSWREGLVPGLTQASGGAFEKSSDPWVAYGPGGRAYYASLLFNETNPANGVYVSVSEDGGRNWGPPVAVHTGDVNNFDDKEAIVVDTRDDSPFRGRVYVAWDTVGQTSQNLRVARSEDGGQSFQPPVSLDQTGVNIGVTPVVGPGGVVHAVWFHAVGNNGVFVASRSEDGGVTWSPFVQVASLRGADVPDLRTAGFLPSVAVDPRNGRLYVVWQDDRFTPGIAQIVLVRSDDGGRTWSAPQRVSDGPDDADSFTAAVAVDGQGRVAVSYYSLRNDPDRHYLVDHYVAVSKDGESFGASRRTNKPSFDARFAAFTDRGFFFGDYQGLVGGRKLFHALWVGTLERSLLHAGERQPDAFVTTIRQ